MPARPVTPVTRSSLSVALVLTACPFGYMTVVGLLAPLLVTMAAEFQVGLPVTGQLAAATSLAWAPAAVLASPFSDRFGRKPLIVLGLGGLSLSTLAASFAGSLPVLLALRWLGGLAGGAVGPSVNAAVIDYFPPAHRGRVLGLVAAGFSLSTLVGVPAVAILAGIVGWRHGFRLVALFLALLAVAALCLLPPLPRPSSRAPESHWQTYAAILRQPLAGPLLLANLAERVAATALSTYLPSVLVLRYRLPLEVLGGLLALMALGTLVGTLLGGALASRPGRPLVFAGCQGTAALLALPLLLTSPGLFLSGGLGVLQGLSGSLSRPAYLWLVGHLSAERRGAVMGLNALTNQGGIVLGSALGGLALAVGGEGALAALVSGSGLLAATIAVGWLREEIAPTGEADAHTF